MEKLTVIALCFVFGSIIGSFLAVCAFRIPMGKYEPVRADIPELDGPLSPLYPRRSFCPRCRQQLKWHHTIPIVSWILLRGRCAFCRTPIPFRYFAIEILAGCVAILCYLRFGVTPTAAFAFLVVCALIVLACIDIDYMILPDVITYPGTLLGVLLGAASSYLPLGGFLPLEHPFTSSLVESLLGIALGAGSLYAAWWLYLVVRKREGLGLGDIKLLAMLGAIFGHECALITIFIGSVLGSVVGLALIALRRHAFSNYISFGPYLIVAAIIYIFDFANLIHHLQVPEDPTIWRGFR
jgi:leader peptidase (prepilin peptidase)/N-methyltransferase